MASRWLATVTTVTGMTGVTGALGVPACPLGEAPSLAEDRGDGVDRALLLDVVDGLADGEAILDLRDLQGVEVPELKDQVGAREVGGGGDFCAGVEGLDGVEDGLAEGSADARRPLLQAFGSHEAYERVVLEVRRVVEVGEGVADLLGEGRV